MAKLWVRIIEKHRIAQQKTISCQFAEIRPRLDEIAQEFDLPAPMWFAKQEKELGTFSLTSFTQDNFVEEIRFDRMEIQFIADDTAHKNSRDPRNQF